jgi:molybdate transport system ATP-binding protein
MIQIDVEARLGEFELRAKFETSGAITALFGPSGSGKTSLVRIIAGLQTPCDGLIRIAGKTLFDKEAGINLAPRQRRVGYVFQDANLFPHFSVKQNLAYSHWAGGRKSEIGIDTVCQVLGIGHLLERRPVALSGGERQRVAIGRAILSDPAVLLLDEPLSALDMKLKFEILPFLEEVRDRFKIPMIYISHSVDEVTRLADYLVVMDEGKLSACGPIEEVLGGLDIRGTGDGLEAGSLLVGNCDSFDAGMGLAQIGVEGQSVSLPISAMQTGTGVRLRIKANDVALALAKPVGTSIQNMLECEITRISQVGLSHVEVGLKLGGQQMRSRITAKAAQDLKLAVGGKCIAMLKAVALEAR